MSTPATDAAGPPRPMLPPPMVAKAALLATTRVRAAPARLFMLQHGFAARLPSSTRRTYEVLTLASTTLDSTLLSL